MTKDEILALIDSAIAGQGTNVDGGGQLATILKGIVNAIPEVGGFIAKTATVTPEQLDEIFSALWIDFDNIRYYPCPFAAVAARLSHPDLGKENDGIWTIGLWQTADLTLDEYGVVNTGSFLILVKDAIGDDEFEYYFQLLY